MNMRASALRWWGSVTGITVAGTPAWRWVVAIGSLLVLVASLYRQIHPTYLNLQDSDFYTYYQAALTVRDGVNPFAPVVAWIQSYHPGDVFVPNFYVYAPIFAFLLVPFTIFPFATASLIWGLLNVALLFGAIYSFLRFAGERVSLLTLLLLTTAASLLSVVRLEFYWGQADILLFFLLCAALSTRQSGHPLVAGLLLAVACITKPPLLIFVVYILWKREYRFVLTTLAGFVVFLLAPALVLGSGVLGDQFTIWSFWSSQYVSFINTESLRGALARLFQINPYVHPIVVAPTLATILWLLFVAGIAVLVATRARPRPLGRDTGTVIEVGLVTTAMLLVSPLTEYIYMTLLLVPLLGLYVLVRRQGLRSPAYLRLAAGAAIIWLLLCFPLQHIEGIFASRMSVESASTAVYVFLALPYLYVTVAAFVLQLHADDVIGVRRLSLWELLGTMYQSAIAYVTDLRGALGRVHVKTEKSTGDSESLDDFQYAGELRSGAYQNDSPLP
jgi:Glycosyltransferase family 87